MVPRWVELMQFLAPFKVAQGPHAADRTRQKWVPVYSSVPCKYSWGQILVSRWVELNPLGCRSIPELQTSTWCLSPHKALSSLGAFITFPKSIYKHVSIPIIKTPLQTPFSSCCVYHRSLRITITSIQCVPEKKQTPETKGCCDQVQGCMTVVIPSS